MAYYVFTHLIHPDTKSTDLPFKDRLGWFMCEIGKNILTMLHIFLAFESVIFILSLQGDESQIGAYTIMFSIFDMLRNVSRGFSILGKIEVSKLLGR